MTTVGELMDRHVIAASYGASASSALRLMSESHVSLIPVVLDNVLVGVVTKDDAQKAAVGQRLSGMKLRALFVKEADSVEKAAKIMAAKVVTRLPVVDDAIRMRLIGIISSTDVVKVHKKMT